MNLQLKLFHYLCLLIITTSLITTTEATCRKYGPSLQIPLLYDGLLQYSNATDSIAICPYGLSFNSDPFTIPIRDANGVLPGCQGPKGDTGPMGTNATCVDGMNGTQGATGADGPQGLHGINSGAFTYTYVFTSQGLPQEPGLGNVSYNGFDNSGPSSLNLITFSSVDKNGANMSMLVDVFANQTTDTTGVLAYMQITSDDDGVDWSSFAVTGVVTGYDGVNNLVVYSLQVSQVGVSVTTLLPGHFLFQDGQVVGVSFSFKGADGPVGPPGNDGPQGTNYSFITQPQWTTFGSWSLLTVRVNSSSFAASSTNTGVDGLTSVYGLSNNGYKMTVLSTVISFTDTIGTNVTTEFTYNATCNVTVNVTVNSTSDSNSTNSTNFTTTTQLANCTYVGTRSSIQLGYMQDSFKLVAIFSDAPTNPVPISNTKYFSGSHNFNETNTFTLPTSTFVLERDNAVGIQWIRDGINNSSDSSFVPPPITYDLIMTLLVFPDKSPKASSFASYVSNDTTFNIEPFVPRGGFLAGWRNPGKSLTKYGSCVVNLVNNDLADATFQVSYTSNAMSSTTGLSSNLQQIVAPNATFPLNLGFMLEADITALTVNTRASCAACFAYVTLVEPAGTVDATTLFSTLVA